MENNAPLTQAEHSLDRQTIFAALRDALATLYPIDQDARRVVDDVGIIAIKITFSARAQTNWHNILAEAIEQDRLLSLLEMARNDYLDNQSLAAACAAYRRLLDEGGRLEPLAQLPGGGDVITAQIGQQ